MLLYFFITESGQIASRDFEAFVAQEFLDTEQIHPGAQPLDGRRVAELVWMNVEIGSACNAHHDAAYGVSGDRMAVVGEE